MPTSGLPTQYLKDAVVVTFPTEVDMANAHAVRTTLLSVLTRNPPAVIIDMTGCRFCDSSGIRALMHAHTRANAMGIPLAIHEPRNDVLRVLTMTGATHVIPVLDGDRPAGSQDASDDEAGPHVI